MAGLGTILTAVVTPFDDDLNIDEESFVAMLKHLADHGSDGVVVAGSTGEAATLDDDEHVGLVELAVQERPHPGFTVVAGAGSNDTRHAVHLTERVTAAGVDGVLSVTPYYVKPTPRGLKEHYAAIARATDKPVLLYNIPVRTALERFPLQAAARRIARAHRPVPAARSSSRFSAPVLRYVILVRRPLPASRGSSFLCLISPDF